jgi:rod shape-determining protein MreC
MSKKFLSPNIIKFLAIAVVCPLLIFANPSGIFNPIRGIFIEISYPFQKTFFFLGKTVSGTFNFLGTIGDIKKENENLLQENNNLSAEVAMLGDEKKENEMLREQLQLVPRDKFNLEAAFVIGQDSERLGSWITLDKGSSEGIVSGMPVIVYEGILIGKISDVTPHTARVVLLTDAGSVVNVLDSETGSKGVLKGEYGLGVVMDMVSQQDALNVGDTVVTSGLGSNISRGLLIGKIQEVRSTGDKLFQQAIVLPRIKYSDMQVAYVIKN